MSKAEKVNLVHAARFLEICNDFWVVLEYKFTMKRVRDMIITYSQVNKNLKNIRKFPKRSLTNNFVRTLSIYSKGHNRIQTMSHPFKGPVTIFGCFEGKKIVKT